MGRIIKKTGAYSFVLGKLGKGCKQCIKGEKLVLFITGRCSNNCYYCPISDQKKNKDVVYANERKIKNLREIVEEAKASRAKGAGITGGDPLARLERTIKVIRMLKKEFGKKFHIHLYTSLKKVNSIALRKLEKAGLDEIRFHPDLDNKELWEKLKLKTRMRKGIEIPVIPGKEKETKKLLDYVEDLDFVNLNELELADNSFNKLRERGYKTKDYISYAVKGSQETARRLLNYCLDKKYDVHYCSSKLKNKVQFGERIKRRAKKTAEPFDVISKEGLLVRGFIETKNTEGVKKFLFRKGVPKNLIKVLDNEILTLGIIVYEFRKDFRRMKCEMGISEVYPTYDLLEIERTYL